MIRVGDRVRANGRIFVQAGEMGEVVTLHECFVKGRTNDVIDVAWDNGDPDCPDPMKYKDLDFEFIKRTNQARSEVS